MIKAGIHTVNSAGNSNDDACKYSPASLWKTITVAATNPEDERVAQASGVQTTEHVLIFLPVTQSSQQVTNPNSSHATMSGTSMSAPHVTKEPLLWCLDVF